ncbi:unnamed protein product [Anisakis simplex]|uniref:Activin_recp domain-containing protein n=1 Tax=Anisakis simplex TaxID=6269 RepID=A0A0M3K876_ANISI|nr:unnamed protein product [Anisakis simplex]
MYRTVILLFTFCRSSQALRCWYCDGDRMTKRGGQEEVAAWMTPSNRCCVPRIVECPYTSAYCLWAFVDGLTKFWISGCNADEFVGCDAHPMPYNATLERCQCQTDLCNPIRRIPNCLATPRNAYRLTTEQISVDDIDSESDDEDITDYANVNSDENDENINSVDTITILDKNEIKTAGSSNGGNRLFKTLRLSTGGFSALFACNLYNLFILLLLRLNEHFVLM